MFFTILTKNLNWKVLNKNIVILRRWDGIRVFQIAVRGARGGGFPSLRRESEIFRGGERSGKGILLPGERNLRKSDFNDSNLFQS